MSHVVSPQLKLQARELTHEILQELEAYSKQVFGKAPRYPKITFSTSPRYTCSWANASPCHIFVCGYDVFGAKTFPEYEFIADDPCIGSVKCGRSWRKYLKVVLVHEYCHLIVDSFSRSINPPRSYKSYDDSHLTTDEQGHDRKWQYVYKKFRQRFVNQ
jgi:hypothetical protein